MRSAVSYIRVSTDRQGQSGLGLAAQKTAVESYLSCSASDIRVIASFVEVESGAKSDRPELQKAIEQVRLTGGILVIAKIDRLSRDAHFLLGLEKAGVDFVACDMPNANRLTIGIMAMVAEEERRLTSTRTKAALHAAKARGVRLGNPNGGINLRGLGNASAVRVVKSRADERARRLVSAVNQLLMEGVVSLNGMAKAFNERSIKAPRGGQWSASSIKNLRNRIDAMA